jgi:hypothetical protein
MPGAQEFDYHPTVIENAEPGGVIAPGMVQAAIAERGGPHRMTAYR